MVELIVFDCDGTLLKSMHVKSRAFEYIGNLYSPEAGKALLEWHLTHGGVNRLEKFAWMFREVLGREMTVDEGEELSRIFREFCIDELRNSQLMPGVVETLQAWHEKIPMYVASGAPQTELLDVLQSVELDRFFEGIYGAPPAKTALLRNIINKSGAATLATVMVGDSHSDLSAAETLGTMFYGLGSIINGTSYPGYEDLTRFNSWLETQL